LPVKPERGLVVSQFEIVVASSPATGLLPGSSLVTFRWTPARALAPLGERVVRIRRFHQVKAGRVGARLLSILLWDTTLATSHCLTDRHSGVWLPLPAKCISFHEHRGLKNLSCVFSSLSWDHPKCHFAFPLFSVTSWDLPENLIPLDSCAQVDENI